MIASWPEVFTDEHYEYADGAEGRMAAIADALSGWATCVLAMPPEGFGQGMVTIMEACKMGPITPDNVMDKAARIQRQRKKEVGR